MLRPIFIYCLICILLIETAYCALPPKYLGLCNWQACVGEKEEGMHTVLISNFKSLNSSFANKSNSPHV